MVRRDTPTTDGIAQYGLWIAGAEAPGSSGRLLDVVYPYTEEVFAQVSVADGSDVERAVGSAQLAFSQHLRPMPAHERSRLLSRVSQLIEEAREDLVHTVVHEVGKPLRDAQIEVGRVSELFGLAAALAREIWGEVVPMDAVRGGEGRMGFVIREPLGVVATIGPFNAPLNLVAQKVAPALAAGNAVVIKPATQTPLSSLKLARIIQEAGFPAGAVNVVVGSGAELGPALTQDDRVRMVSLTGSVEAGERVLAQAGIKRVALELGSNAPNIVCADADLAAAAASIARASFHSAGQQCISAQRLFVEGSVYDVFLGKLLTAVAGLKVGDPMDPEVELGPMISRSEVERLLEWLDEAQQHGAQILTGGKALGNNILAPTVVAESAADMKIRCQEIFGPVVTISRFRTGDEAVGHANDSRFGLQAAVFTRDLDAALEFARELHYGCVWINEASRYRQDNYPFGGVKDSGIGREGVKYAIQEVTEMKFVGIKTGARK